MKKYIILLLKILSVIIKIVALGTAAAPSYFRIPIWVTIIAIAVLVIFDIILDSKIITIEKRTSELETKTKHIINAEDGFGIEAGKKFYLDM